MVRGRAVTLGTAALLLTAAATAACGDGDGAPGSIEPGRATVVGVVDGDTIDVRVGGRDERVRLIGIDTPETKRPDTPVECFGPEATAFTTSLLPDGTAVTLTRDVEARDDYGRLLAYVHRVRDGLFVNEALVRGGYAQPFTYPPNVTYADRFVEAARDAEARRAGLWSACR